MAKGSCLPQRLLASTANFTHPLLPFLPPVMQAQAAIQQQFMESVAEKLTHVCYKRCVTSHSEKHLSEKQARCLDSCAKTFMEGFPIAVRTAGRRGEREWGRKGLCLPACLKCLSHTCFLPLALVPTPAV